MNMIASDTSTIFFGLGELAQIHCFYSFTAFTETATPPNVISMVVEAAFDPCGVKNTIKVSINGTEKSLKTDSLIMYCKNVNKLSIFQAF